jgi:two-component sensor histidine kinase
MTFASANAELRRQIRNLFAMLRSIVRRSAAGRGSKADYAAHLETRIGALARVHEMLMRAPDAGIDLEELLHGELLAQAVRAQQYRISGPDTRIGMEAAMPMALAFHELAVNASIHGALCTREGRLEVAWHHQNRDGRQWLDVHWQERGAPCAGNPPTNKGFGMELLEHTLPYELGACTRIEWLAEEGVDVLIQLPAGANAVFWRPGERLSA